MVLHSNCPQIIPSLSGFVPSTQREKKMLAHVFGAERMDGDFWHAWGVGKKNPVGIHASRQGKGGTRTFRQLKSNGMSSWSGDVRLP